jgi:hypothetical protein
MFKKNPKLIKIIHIMIKANNQTKSVHLGPDIFELGQELFQLNLIHLKGNRPCILPTCLRLRTLPEVQGEREEVGMLLPDKGFCTR